MATVENCSLADRMDRVYEIVYSKIYALLMMASKSEITASTINTWISPDALYANTPNNQPMINTTAMI